MNNLPEILEPSHPIYLALKEIQKPRSKFQLENFVAGQHDTKEQQYKQILLEIQSLVYNIQVITLELKKMDYEIDKLKNTGDYVDEIDAQIKELSREQAHLTIIGAKRELQDLIEMWESFEHKYTYEEIEDNQKEYWNLRLTRQAQLEAIGSGKVAWASLDSLRQIGKSEEIIFSQDIKKEIE